MATTSVEAPGGATVAQRWLARLALVTPAAAVLMPPLAIAESELRRLVSITAEAIDAATTAHGGLARAA